ncbi:DNA-binding response regulator, OmpR family, contains REC and winged-helix (wHTH) domain [Paramaledivibacter caminithermalis DSM 15212]|uniref:Stage 0 sporulation protein A homolog n=1 Tax=Paramaledivibacter caminithermalis (strain DSM 15212 / CIP 107654 / DViRD3) TaxID=1121301 RepID=A0A1M6R2F5_PARC5|nr:response regulator transcription factor [Paramaledivibacter caminithermalis]SHK26634.1 DNA-binding response regulator, OmpR family, contains REC and winged-helix (wHTH) domain [Paramaledivibacter caminithermalis DSM 15212]
MKEKFKILVIEDEVKILNVIEAYLEKEGYEVYKAIDGTQGLNIFKDISPHLVILDLMLPGMSGENICKNIRSTSDIPIIMLTAKTNEKSKIEGFSLGADDYVTKPFSPRELIERVRVILRRSYRDKGPLSDIISFNNDELRIDIKKHEVTKNKKLVILTPNEYRILLILASNPGQIFSREQLVENVFGIDYDGFDRTIDTHIKNIRQKIEDNPKTPKYILTIYGMGYKFGG